MASRQTVHGNFGRRPASDLRALDLHTTATPNRLHRSTTDPETASAQRRCRRMEFAQRTLDGSDSSQSPPIEATPSLGRVSANAQGRDVELNQMDIDTPLSTNANNASDGSSEIMMREEVELLLSLSQSQPCACNPVIGCTFRNVRYIYLTQASIYKLMNLETTMRSYGEDVMLVMQCMEI